MPTESHQRFITPPACLLFSLEPHVLMDKHLAVEDLDPRGFWGLDFWLLSDLSDLAYRLLIHFLHRICEVVIRCPGIWLPFHATEVFTCPVLPFFSSLLTPTCRVLSLSLNCLYLNVQLLINKGTDLSVILCDEVQPSSWLVYLMTLYLIHSPLIFHQHQQCPSSSETLCEIYEVPLQPLHQDLYVLVTERNPDLFRCFVTAGCQLTAAEAEWENKTYLED